MTENAAVGIQSKGCLSVAIKPCAFLLREVADLCDQMGNLLNSEFRHVEKRAFLLKSVYPLDILRRRARGRQRLRQRVERRARARGALRRRQVRHAQPAGPGPADVRAPELRRVLPSRDGEAYRIMERYKADLAQRAEDEAARMGPRALGD